MTEIDRILQFATDHDIKTVDFKLCNLFGGWHHITMPIARLNEDLLKNGVGVDGSSIPGFKVKGISDLQLIPDTSTRLIDPFWDVPTLSFICSLFKTGTLEPFPLDPRQIALRAEKYLISSGIATRSHWLPEYEFYIFDGITFTNEINLSMYRIDSAEAAWNRCESCSSETAYPIPSQRGYHIAPPQDRYFNLRNNIVNLLEELGIPIKYHHHEVGGPGQEEIETVPGPLVKSADNGMMIKYITKMMALQEDLCVTFMPKPLTNTAGSGLHFHQHLFMENQPLFFDEKGYSGLSQLALYYIGGLLKHSASLMALTNPSTNSYKRLVPGYEAPTKAFFGAGNRASALRIPTYATAPMDKRIELRTPDATCNIYLAMAAQLMAGIDGIVNKIDPIANGWGPFETDLHLVPKDKLDIIPDLPSCMAEAMEALQHDHDYLLAGGVFPESLVDNWVNWKLEKEDLEMRRRPHPYEMDLYFNV